MATPRSDDETTQPGGTSEAPPSEGNQSHSHDSIAERAYRRFEERGGEHGRDLDDWLEAERELTRRDNE